MDDQFQVALISNSSLTHCPHNSPNNFTTKFALPYTLDGEWEAALMDIQYPHPTQNWQMPVNIAVAFHEDGRRVSKHDDFDVKINEHMFTQNITQVEHRQIILIKNPINNGQVSIPAMQLAQWQKGEKLTFDPLLTTNFIEKLAQVRDVRMAVDRDEELKKFPHHANTFDLALLQAVWNRLRTLGKIRTQTSPLEWICERDQPTLPLTDQTFELEFSHYRFPNEQTIQTTRQTITPVSPYIPPAQPPPTTQPQGTAVSPASTSGDAATSTASAAGATASTSTATSQQAVAPPEKETRTYQIKLIESNVSAIATSADLAQIWKTETHLIWLYKPFTYARFVIQPSYFSSVEHLCAMLNSKIKNTILEMGLSMSNAAPFFSYDIDSDRIKSTMGSVKSKLISDSPYLSKILGISMEDKLPRGIFVFNIDADERRGNFVPELDFIKVMFIYSDIIKFQTVADVQAPLLAVIPVRGEDKKQNYWACQPPYYTTVLKQEFDSIAIRICTDTGDLFPFDGNGKVICRLHFRRKRLG